ncbi:hypothetical protein DFQ28_002675 [Apophysomyces sp. BC1034]|nr:hypothetical protein DFQ29_006096 [Apophysomyces sp. BC1021]KAG0189950.1 hypothetical protein DFQ28_002675 [Apophysomyces sp. BC1034]
MSWSNGYMSTEQQGSQSAADFANSFLSSMGHVLPYQDQKAEHDPQASLISMINQTTAMMAITGAAENEVLMVNIIAEIETVIDRAIETEKDTQDEDVRETAVIDRGSVIIEGAAEKAEMVEMVEKAEKAEKAEMTEIIVDQADGLEVLDVRDARERKLQNWDMAPPGMDMMSAEQVKQTGLFPLPGQVVGTRTPQSFAPPSELAMMSDGSRVRVTQGAAGPVALNATLARQARRLYVGQIPLGIDENTMAEFFNETMQQSDLPDRTSVVAVQINHEKNYAFVEFHTPEQATTVMAFDGIMYRDQPLKIRRPKDYQPPMDYMEGMQAAAITGLVSTNVPDTPNKIFVGGLPMYLNEEQVMELLKSFGELRAFNLVKDTMTGQSKGFAFCEYADASVTDLACQGLNEMELGERKLVVQRASVGAKHSMATEMAMGPVIDFVPIMAGVKEDEATRVLTLMNMVTPEELENDDEYQDIWDDIEEECSKYGKVMDIKIPRPKSGHSSAGLGKIYVRFETNDQTLAALRALAGRKFSDRTVLTSFLDEDNYLADNF